MKLNSYASIFIVKVNEIHISINEKSNREIPWLIKIYRDTSLTKTKPESRDNKENGPVLTNDKQTHGSHSLSIDPTFMKDAQCAETNEKTIFRFLFLSYRENSSKIDSF